MERFTDNDSPCHTSGGEERIAVGDFVTEICAARAERHVADWASSGAAGKQSGDEGKGKQFGYVGKRVRLKSHATGSVEPPRLAQSHFTALSLHSFVSALKSMERVKGIEPS